MSNPWQEPAALEAAAQIALFLDPAELNISADERIRRLQLLIATGRLDSLAHGLPVLLNLKSKPYTLDDHFPFEEIFRFRMPSSIVYKTGRQVSKSTSLAAHGVVTSVSIPNFTTLYVTPLFEQIRRFSTMFVQPFIDGSPVKQLWCGTDTVNSVLHRSFKSHSKMVFSFALLNADRMRGISADKVAIDESSLSTTNIRTYVNGHWRTVQIKDVNPGDYVESCQGGIDTCASLVLNKSYHGFRRCFELSFANGAKLAVTAESKIATTEGWKRVSELIQHVHDRKCSRATTAGNTARRRQYDISEKWINLSQPARLVPACLQSDKAGGLIYIRHQASREEEELRLRGMVEYFTDTFRSGLFAVAAPVLQSDSERVLLDRSTETTQDSNSELASSCRTSGTMASNSVVGRRRRKLTRNKLLATNDFPHRGLQRRRSATTSGLAVGAQNRMYCASSKEPQESRQTLLDNQLYSTRYINTNRAHKAIHSSTDGLQDSVLQAYTSSMHLLSSGIYTPTSTIAQPTKTAEATVLSEQTMPQVTASGIESEIDGKAGQTCSQKRTAARALLQQSRTQSADRQANCCSIPRKASGACKREQTKTTCENTGNAKTENMDMPVLRTARASGRQELQNKVLPALQIRSHAQDQNSVCSPTEITGIRYIGKHDTYDIEVADTHTFFADGVLVKNCQDMNREHLPIIRETMSASPWALKQYTGTPKTLDNTLEGLWQESSQAEWFIPCLHCTTDEHPTWNIPSLEFNLEKMIGPYRTDIKESAPATICHKCGGIISPRMGRWVHRYPERLWHQAGYHVPQVIMPLHYAKPDKWAELLAKQAGRGNTPINVFYNEILGESYDTAAKLVTLTELNAVSNLGPNTDKAAVSRLANYKMRVLGVDWGGGGEKQVSFTTIALLGMRWDGKIDVIWGKRLLTPHDHLREARDVMRYWQMFTPDLLAHDYTGAGSLRETFLIQAGVPARCVMPCAYVRAASQRPCFHVAPTAQHPRSHYRVDKSRSLLLTCSLIKTKQLHFFDNDYTSDEDPGLIRDWLALIEEKVSTMGAGEIYRIGRQEGFSDDFAQAVNFGCVAIWHRTNVWPNLANLADYSITDEQLRAAVPSSDSDWDDELI